MDVNFDALISEMKAEDSEPNEDGNDKEETKDGLSNETNDHADDLIPSTEVDNTVSEDIPLGENEDVRTISRKDDQVLSSTDQTGSTPEEEDEENEEGSPKEDKVDSADLIKTLGYRPLTLQIFHKMRETFGHEECEYCGKLYYNKIDYDQHIRTHTGNKRKLERKACISHLVSIFQYVDLSDQNKTYKSCTHILSHHIWDITNNVNTTVEKELSNCGIQK